MLKNMKKKMHLTLQLMIHLTRHSRDIPKRTFDGTPKHALNNLHTDAQEGACEVALKGALEVVLKLHLWLHLLIQWLMHKCLQNDSSNGRPDAALEGELDGRLNVGF